MVSLRREDTEGELLQSWRPHGDPEVRVQVEWD